MRKKYPEPIPCLDLKLQHQHIRKEIFEAFEKVYEKTAFSGGSFAEQFEKDFSAYIGTKYAIAVNNGTSALQLAMQTIGIGPGDEVIVPANTFIATAWGVSYAGATPVFVDCDPNTWEIDPKAAARAISPKTKAIIGVHLYGMPFDIDSVRELCTRHQLFLIEDAAQAQGAFYGGTRVGTFGELACFSFYPGKNLGACGEAGGLTTNNQYYKETLFKLRNHGSSERYYHDIVGYNMRMGGLEAASLSVKLKYLDEWNGRRKKIAARYQAEIRNPLIIPQQPTPKAESVYHLFVIKADNRNEFVDYLKEWNIHPGFHYPVPCHLQKAYAGLGYQRGDCPHSESLADRCVSLPMYNELTDEEVDYVIETVNRYKQ